MGALRLKRVQTMFVGYQLKHRASGVNYRQIPVEVLTAVCSESGSNWPI